MKTPLLCKRARNQAFLPARVKGRFLYHGSTAWASSSGCEKLCLMDESRSAFVLCTMFRTNPVDTVVQVARCMSFPRMHAWRCVAQRSHWGRQRAKPHVGVEDRAQRQTSEVERRPPVCLIMGPQVPGSHARFVVQRMYLLALPLYRDQTWFYTVGVQTVYPIGLITGLSCSPAASPLPIGTCAALQTLRVTKVPRRHRPAELADSRQVRIRGRAKFPLEALPTHNEMMFIP